MFVVSWTGVIKFHGPKPTAAPNRVWVANHTSMIDYIILSSYFPFAVIMQLHPGWVGWLQRRVLSCLGCLWFKRTEVRCAVVSEGLFAGVCGIGVLKRRVILAGPPGRDPRMGS